MKRKFSGAAIAVIFTMFIIFPFPPPALSQELSPVVSPTNPDFQKELEEQSAKTFFNQSDGLFFGFFPSPLDRSHLIGQGKRLEEINASFPSSFDLRSLGKTPPVRDQGNYGTCWAFASFGSLESALLPSESWDFSEDNLVNMSGFDMDPYNGGGNFDMATAYLARWSGPLREDQDPYPSPGTLSLEPAKHIQDVLFLPGRSGPLDNDLIKSALMSYGALGTYIYWDSHYFNSAKNSYYFPGVQNPNHAVAIVGWDDQYPASNFSPAPPGNGAFIVRNSWGSSWGEGGYFFISYFDSIVGKELTAFNSPEPVSNFSRIYQYDTLGWTASLGYENDTAWFANAFTASSAENLVGVSFYSPSLNSQYQVYGGSSLQSLSLLASGVLPYPGYHTVRLDSPYPLAANQKFFVAVKLTTPGYNYPIPMEYPWSGYSSRASASLGQSFISPDGSNWTDLYTRYTNSNVCLKAFTSSASSGVSFTPTSFYFEAALGKGNPSFQILSIRSTGGTLNWAVSSSASWLTVFPKSGSSSGETDTVSVSVIVDGLDAGNYQGQISIKDANSLQVLGAIPVNLKITQENQAQGFSTIKPSSFSVQKGTGTGDLSTLFSDDSQFLRVESAFISPYHYIEWTADFQVPDPGSVKVIGVRFRGFNSRSVSTYLKLYNWSTKRWDSLKSASISTTEKEILGLTMDCSKYISSTGQMRVQVYGRTVYSSFSNSADLLEVLAGYSISALNPSSFSVQKGTGTGDLSTLFSDDSQFLRVESAFISPYHYIEWTADFQVPDPGSVKVIGVRFRGFNSRSVSTYLKLYNWSTKRWDSFTSASLSTTEKEIVSIALNSGKYISSTGQLRVQVYSRTTYSSFTNSAELLEVLAGY
ncbi:MAG: lectin like domain-containing protein [Caldiserica bacterium]|jgi:C1A family cysteine protease|nr:lectin like domain-containing protein [Caldisericota bacterium]MDH7562089.1 lectin like domain-containing protein [Caldisericota bacterium]